jgi:hypothetical protein
MAGLTDFLNQRKKVSWAMVASAPNTLLLEAHSPDTLDHATWALPKGQFNEPKVRRGKVQVTSDAGRWLLDAGDCREISVEMTRKQGL